MNDGEFAQLKAMSKLARLNHYLKKKIAGEITAEKYEQCIAFALSLEDKETQEESGTNGTNPREQRNGHSLPWIEADKALHETERFITPESFVAQMERPDQSTFPAVANDATNISSGGNDPSNTSQKSKLLKLLMDGEFHATPEIQEVVYGSNHLGCARIAARADDLRRDGHIIESRKISRTIWEYRLGQKDERITQIVDNMMAG